MDVLRRAGVEVTVAGVQLKNSIFAQGSRKINIVPDVVFEEQGVKWDAVSKVYVAISYNILVLTRTTG